jgi:hypothetical protein
MTSQGELPKRNFIDHYRGRKGPFIFIVSIYLMIVVILLSSVNEKADIKDLLSVILGFTLLISGILYWGYAEYHRIIISLEKSGVLIFLRQQGFQIREEKSGLNYEIIIQGQINSCLIIVTVDRQKGNIWAKNYLKLLGLPDDQLKLVETKGSDKVRIKECKELIRLTKSTETKSKLDKSLSQFIKELRTVD